jgi:DNA-binding IclR family transcriptional regulator
MTAAADGATAPKGTGERYVLLLGALAEQAPPYRLSDLSRRLGLSPSTIHRMLAVMREHRLIEEGEDRSYVMGPELYRIASLLAQNYDPVTLAREQVQYVVETCGEVGFYCDYRPATQEIVPVVVEYGTQRLQYRVDLFTPLSAAWGASGLAVIAFLTPEERRRAWQRMGDTSPTGQPRPDWSAYDAFLADVRRNRSAWTRSQKMPGAVGFSAPVFGPRNRVVGSLCATLPEHRFHPGSEVGIIDIVRDGAARLSRALGGRFPPDAVA